MTSKQIMIRHMKQQNHTKNMIQGTIIVVLVYISLIYALDSDRHYRT